MAVQLYQAGKLSEAEEACHLILAADALRTETLMLLSNCRWEQGDHEQALKILDVALEIAPNFLEGLNNRGLLLLELGKPDQALADFDRALRLDPDYAKACYNRGNALQALKWFDEAVAGYDRALALKPDYAEAYLNRGNACFELRQIHSAVASYEGAIATRPDYAEAYWNKALALLTSGNFEQGWPLYEWRWKRDQMKPCRPYPAPLWLGEKSLSGQTVLVHAEQGLGDSIQFCRYLPDVAALGAKVIFEIHSSLISLFNQLTGIEHFIEQGADSPPIDYHVPLLSLPLAFRTTVRSIPAKQAYLQAGTEQVAQWKSRLGHQSVPRIGLVWSGAVTYKRDQKRSIPLETLLADLPQGVEYVSLQKDVRAADEETLRNAGVRRFERELTDFSETAALIACLDLVLSVDTSVAHLSGALGKPTWILLPYLPDWRWLLDRTDSPWYPTVRLFRQATAGDWKGVIQTASRELGMVLNLGDSAAPRYH